MTETSVPGMETCGSSGTGRKHDFDFLSDTAMPTCEIQLEPPLGEITDLPTTLASPSRDQESELYYVGLPSCPLLLARSSTFLWEAPEAYPNRKILRNVGTHSIVGLMDKVGPDIIETLDLKSVPWTSVDVL